MDAPPSVSPEVLAALPAEVLALIQWMARQIAQLQREVAELKARLDKDSTNSSIPPSATHPHAKPPSARPQSKRPRGGQPGHPKAERALIPVEDCQAVVPCVPTECRRCGRALRGTDPEPLRHQVWELPDIQPAVTEYRRHRLVCACGCSTCGDLPVGVPSGQAGPRLVAFAGLLMACFRQSKRRAAQFLSTALNQPASAGWMALLQGRCAEAVQPAYDELARQLPAQGVLHIDESPTKEGSSSAWVWTFVAGAFTLFACRTSRGADVPEQLLGEGYAGVIHCDRARMCWRFGRLQWCWAHLRRDIQALIDAPCHTKKRLGRDLMRPTKELFGLWKRVRDGTTSRRTFARRMRPIRQQVGVLLLRGYFNGLTRGVCRGLWDHREHL
jgi:transposase